MATIVEASVEDIVAGFLIALAIFFIIVATWGPLQAIENMLLEDEKNRIIEDNTARKHRRNIANDLRNNINGRDD